MKKYIVTVNGKKYEVEVEEVASSKAAGENIVETKAPAQDVKKEEVKRAVETPKSAGGRITIKAPMPGTILDVRISKGQNIKKGDVMFILEAMKMENEIMAGEDGIVVDVAVSKGASVNTDDLLATLD